MTLLDPSWQRLFYAETALALLSVLALIGKTIFDISWGTSRYRAIWLALILAIVSIGIYSELFFWIGWWAFPAGHKYYEALNLLWFFLEPFKMPQIDVLLAVIPGCLTTLAVISFSNLRSRIIAGALMSVVSVFILDLFATLVFQGLHGFVGLQNFLGTVEVQLVGITMPAAGVVVALLATPVDSLLMFIIGGRLYGRAERRLSL
jgi:hypothetical protein